MIRVLFTKFIVGGTNWDEGTSIAIDNSSYVYTIGHFEGTVDFDPGTGIFNLTSVGEKDGFIFKLDSTGDFIWAKQFGDSAFVENNAIALDAAGNIGKRWQKLKKMQPNAK